MKISKIIWCAICILGIAVQAQDKEDIVSDHYYYYKGQKIYLELDRQHIYVVSDEAEVVNQLMNSKNNTANRLVRSNKVKGINQRNVVENKQIEKPHSWAEIEFSQVMDNTSYTEQIAFLTDQESVDFVAPFFKNATRESVGVTQYFYVKLKETEDIEVLQEYALLYDVEIISQNELAPLWYTLECKNNNVLKTVNAFYESGAFSVAEPNFLIDYKLTSTETSRGDHKQITNKQVFETSTIIEYLDDQWGLKNTGQYGGISDIDIDALRAWEIEIGSRDIKTAVVDEGFIDTNSGVFDVHYDLAENNYGRGYDPQTGGYSQIYGYHGVTCAGIIASQGSGTGGSTGVAHNSRIMSVSIDFQKTTSIFALTNGIRWAADAGADIISNSWGGGFPSDMLDDAIEYALTSGRNGLGCVVVFSAGNDNYGRVNYPATSHPDILAVGGVSPCGERKNPGSCDGENWGSNYGNHLDLVAPCVLVTTTDLRGNNGYNSNLNLHLINGGNKIGQDYENVDYTKVFSGTSAAAPFVSGVAALVLSVNPDLTVREVNDILEKSATKVREDLYAYNIINTRPNGGWNEQTGYGMVNAFRALILAQNCDENDCCPYKREGDLTLLTQEEVDDFEYCEVTGTLTIGPLVESLQGLSSLEKVGALHIESLYAEDLEGLQNLTTIYDSLIIGDPSKEDTNSLVNLDALSGLENIGGDIVLSGCKDLKSILGFSNLTTVAGNFEINNAQTLENLNGLQGIVSVKGNIILSQNAKMSSLFGLDNLVGIDGNLTIEKLESLLGVNSLSQLITVGNLRIKENEMLTNLNGLSGLESVKTISIESNAAITDVDGLSNLQRLNGSIYIYNNNALIDIDGFKNVVEMIGGIEIEGNDSLLNLDGFAGIKNIDYFYLMQNISLVNIDGMNALQSVDSEVYMTGNTGLKNLDGFSNVSSLEVFSLTGHTSLENACGILGIITSDIADFIGVSNNTPNTSSIEAIIDDCTDCKVYEGDYLIESQADIDTFDYCEITGHLTIDEAVSGDITDVSPLHHLQVLDGGLYIKNNTAITHLDGLSQLTVINGSLQLLRNSSLTDISGLQNIQQITGNILMQSNNRIESLSAFNALTILDGNLNINWSSGLTDLDGFVQLSRIGGSVEIKGNANMINITGLNNVTAIQGSLKIIANGFHNLNGLINLEQASSTLVQNNASLSNACGLMTLINNGGVISFENNGPDTSTKEDVIDYCLTHDDWSKANAVIENTNIWEIKLSPNPVNNELNIHSNKDFQEISIVNFAGQVLYKSHGLMTNVVTIKDIDYPSGVYFVRVHLDKEVLIKKIVIQ